MNRTSDTRLYAGAIAIVSGVYSILSGANGMGSMVLMPVMLVIGVVVLLHGLILLSPEARRLGNASGPLMIVWAVIMLGVQVVAGLTPNTMARPGSWDGGMVAAAVLMLASGAIMTRRGGMD